MVLKLFRIRNQDIQQEQQGLPRQTLFRVLHHEIIKTEKKRSIATAHLALQMLTFWNLCSWTPAKIN